MNTKWVIGFLVGAVLLGSAANAKAALIMNGYEFNVAEAETYFDTSVTLASTHCLGGVVDCALANKPDIPPPPSVEASEASYVSDISTFFYEGGFLNDGLSITVNVLAETPGKNGSGDWRFIYTYSITPNVLEEIPALTAWDPIAASVPEPSTWAMLILGFAGVAFMAYRRSRKDQGLALAAA